MMFLGNQSETTGTIQLQNTQGRFRRIAVGLVAVAAMCNLFNQRLVITQELIIVIGMITVIASYAVTI